MSATGDQSSPLQQNFIDYSKLYNIRNIVATAAKLRLGICCIWPNLICFKTAKQMGLNVYAVSQLKFVHSLRSCKFGARCVWPTYNSLTLIGLGHNGDPAGTRTRDTAVKGRCLNRLTTGPCIVWVNYGSGERIWTADTAGMNRML